jgi:hypothetical protein
MKMEQTECSETLVTKLHTLENIQKENIRHSKHSESLKSRIIQKNDPFFEGFEKSPACPSEMSGMKMQMNLEH